MINALFSSKPSGSKLFQRADNCVFGWQTIDRMYERELQRVDKNLTRMVPCLREAHCLRDAWTKLNVHPAKIMQVRACVFISSMQWNCMDLCINLEFLGSLYREVALYTGGH